MTVPVSLQEIKTIKENERQKITLVKSSDGKTYLKRTIYGDKREIYKTLQKINSPHIPKIYSVQFDGETTVYEEYVNGISLADFINKGIKLDKKNLHLIVQQILSAIEALHKSGIIHKDIKPDNIIVDKSAHVWLIDYDIARIYRNEVRKDTELNGTFGYAPPEQYGLMPTDYKTDIYSFGVTLKTLLDYSKIKGYLYKIAEKCKRLDPTQRYKSVCDIKKAIFIQKFAPVSILLMSVIIIIASVFFINPQSKQTSSMGITQQTETDSYTRFLNFKSSKSLAKYQNLENINTTSIFSGEEYWQYIAFFEDLTAAGTVLLGKNQGTPISGEFSLENGVFSVSLEDELGHSFSKDFYYDGTHSFNAIYPDNRRVTAEIMCRDLDGDGIEELLIGICDCSLITTETSIYMYFNYSLGWALKYDESRGFMLCEGDMFSENSKLVFIKNDLRVHLPYAAANSTELYGYILKDNKLIPFMD